MNAPFRTAVVAVCLLVAFNPFWAHAVGDTVSFERDIRPILSNHCFPCHGPDENTREADLRLDTSDGARGVLASGDSAGSELLRRVTIGDPDEVMPPQESNRPLTPEQIERLRQWIDDGAPWGEHWSFKPLAKPPVPRVSRGIGSPQRNPIDLFVQAMLEKQRLKPSPEAAKSTLLRRVTLDLTGLPPSPEQVDEFLDDPSADAFEKVVDRLLQSPAYGERMAWQWLDAARYADSNGYQGDSERSMWPWRDWVVDAFNRGQPYDQFSIDQLAGDLRKSASFEQKLATGFCRNHMINGEGGRIPEENRVDYVMDMTETMGTVWLGLTVNCCRCHDHKYDPISQREYYQLFAFFNQTPVDGAGRSPQTAPLLAVPTRQAKARLAALESRLTSIADELKRRQRELAAEPADWEQEQLRRATDLAFAAENETLIRAPRGERDSEQMQVVTAAHRASDNIHGYAVKRRDETKKQLQDLRNSLPKVMVMQERDEPRQTRLLVRGLYNNPGVTVPPDVPASLPALSNASDPNRLALAKWLMSAQNPLTARVTVNRFWQQVFGVGLVKTTGDFGIQGEIPVHHELLDWLASDFREHDWDVKRLVRLIVTSHTYRQSSRRTGTAGTPVRQDPENRLMARGPRFRMPSWMIRDQALAAAGLLVARPGGPPVNGYQPPGVWEEATFGKKQYRQDHGAALYRRSLYTFWRRIIAPTIFFDSASRQTCTVKVVRTNTPLHALLTLNDITYVEAARAMAQEVLTGPAADDAGRVDEVYRRLLARRASDLEGEILLGGLNRSRDEYREDTAAATELLGTGESPRDPTLATAEHAAWTVLCLAVLNLDETQNKD